MRHETPIEEQERPAPERSDYAIISGKRVVTGDVLVDLVEQRVVLFGYRIPDEMDGDLVAVTTLSGQILPPLYHLDELEA